MLMYSYNQLLFLWYTWYVRSLTLITCTELQKILCISENKTGVRISPDLQCRSGEYIYIYILQTADISQLK